MMIAGPRAGNLSAGLTRRDAAMTEFTLGARASCSDGACGVVSGTILDPAARTVTHLVIESQHGTGGRLVPAEEVLADTWSGAGDYSSIGMGLGHRTPLVIS